MSRLFGIPVLQRARWSCQVILVWLALGCWVAARGATITWTNSNGGSWNTANNWSPNQVPGAGDTALINNNGSYTVTLSANAQISSLIVGAQSGTQTLSVVSQTLTITNGGAINANGVLNLNSTTLAGWVSVGGTLNCLGATFGNGAVVTISSNAVLNITGSFAFYLYGVLTNAGIVNWGGTASIQIYNNYSSASQTGGIVNAPGGMFSVQSDQSVSGGGSPYFNNLGTLQKISGTNTTTINVPFNNTGTLDIQSGILAFSDGGTSSGTITGPGSVSVANGTFTLTGSAPNLILSGGTLSGVGAVVGKLTLSNGTLQQTNLVVTGQWNWNGGSLGNGGTVTVASNAVLNTSGSFTLYLYGTLTNAGTVNWAGTASLAIYNNNSGQSGGIVNEPGALFNVQNDQSLSGSGSPYFNNLGTFQKSAGTNTTTINVPFNNVGSVNVMSGTVAFANGGTSSGTIAGAGLISVPSSTYTLSGSVPNLVLSGGTVYGVDAVIGQLTFNAGTLLETNLIVTGQWNWSGGSLGNGSTVTVASNAVLNTLGSFTLYLYGVLTNAGTINLGGTASLAIYNSGSQTGGIVNQAGGLFNVLNDQYLSGSGSPYFNNFGTFQKSAGTNTTTINVQFNNTGAVKVMSGTVAFAGGGVSSGAISGPGSVSVTSGNYVLNGAAPNLILSGGTLYGAGGAIGNLTINGGTLQGTNLVLTGQGNWVAGSLGSGSTLTVASNAVLNISQNFAHYLSGVLSNAGTVNWRDAATLQIFNDGGSQTGGIVNEASGVFNAQNDQYMTGSGSGYFINLGKFWKSAGTNGTVINVPFINRGTLSLNIYGPTIYGQVRFSGSVALDGELNLNFTNGYSPSVGDSFAVVTYGSQTGLFSALSFTPAPGVWETNMATYGSTTFTLTIGSIYKLGFSSPPAGTNTAGAVFAPVVVQVQNLDGSPFATNAVPITLAISSGSGALSGTTTKSTDPSRRATFGDLSINLSGPKTLTASSPPWVTPASSPSMIVAAPPSQLRIASFPVSLQKQGYTFAPSPTVLVLDSFGNVVSNSSALVTASFAASGGGTLTGTLGVNANGSDGSATFGNLHYTLGNPGQAESVTLYFNSPGLVTATNSPVTVDFVPGTLTLSNGNSVVQIDPNSQNGVFAWIVDGTSQLFQQWFWLRLTNGPQISFDQLGSPLGTSWTAANALFTYLSRGLATTLSFSLQGGAVGSHASTLTETISLQNTNTIPVSLHLYAYTDLGLNGSDTEDVVTFPSTNVVVQEGKGVTATQSVQGPAPNFWQAGWYPLLLDAINSANPVVLSDTIVPNLPGDQTFAYQWDLTVPAGQTLVLSLVNNLPTRAGTLSIASAGANVLLFWPTNGADNLKLQSISSLGTGATWTNVLTAPLTVGTDYHLTVQPVSTAQFFRLH